MASGPSFRLKRGWAEARVFVVPAVVLLAVTLPHLGQGDFRGDTGWYGAIGLQAWRTGELWTLYADPGQPYFNKPPMGFWIHGLFLHLLGVSVWVARLPTVLAALGCVLATAGVARELAGRRAGLLSGVVLALTLDFFRRTREISLDMWQACFLLLGVWCVTLAVSKRNGWWAAASGLFVGGALLTKPLMGLVFFPLIGGWLLWIGRGRLLGWLGAAVAVSVMVAAPWHISMAQMHGDAFVGQYFGAEIAKRATGELQAGHATAPPLWFYVQFLLEAYWPWLVVVALAAVWLVRGRAIARSARGPWLAVLWAGVWFVLLTIFPDRRDRYALVFLPALAWMAGMWLSYASYPRKRGVLRVAQRGLAPVMAAGAIVFALLPVQVQKARDAHWQELFAWVEANTEADDGPRLWQGGVEASSGARLYLGVGEWPQTTRNRWGELVDSPPAGALILYHYRGGLAPGPGEEVVFTSGNGDLAVARLAGEWRPREITDPGD